MVIHVQKKNESFASNTLIISVLCTRYFDVLKAPFLCDKSAVAICSFGRNDKVIWAF